MIQTGEQQGWRWQVRQVLDDGRTGQKAKTGRNHVRAFAFAVTERRM